MTWREQMQDGSFRGAAFLITESDLTFGRRNQLNEYPGRDTPFAKDLGRAARSWSVECLVIGDDYMTDRDALIAACEAAGSGTLVHPYLGTLQVVADPANRVSESTVNGGMASFSLTFHEAGQNLAPAATADTQAQAVAAASTLQTTGAAAAGAAQPLTGSAAYVTAANQGVVADIQTNLSSALAAVQAPAAALSSINQAIVALSAGGYALLSSPSDLSQAIFSAVSQVAGVAPYADDALTVMQALMGYGSDLQAVAVTTPTRAVQAANQLAIVQQVQCAAAAAAVVTVSEMDFDSYDDAVSVRDPLADQLDDLALSLADAGADDLAESVDALRLALIADVTARGGSLARLYAFTPPTTLPAVVIAYQLYGDAERADEIVARNNIVHPGFVPPLALEVLSDE